MVYNLRSDSKRLSPLGYALFSGTPSAEARNIPHTIHTFQQNRHFQKTENAQLFIQTLEHYRAPGKFLLHAYAVMPDHVHILLTPAIDVSTAKAIQYI